jgi:hypothetical protein
MKTPVAVFSIISLLSLACGNCPAQVLDVPLHVTIDDSVWEMHFGVGVGMHYCYHPFDGYAGHSETQAPNPPITDIPYSAFNLWHDDPLPVLGCLDHVYSSRADFRSLLSSTQSDTFRIRCWAGPRYSGTMSWDPNCAAQFSLATLTATGTAGTIQMDMLSHSTLDLTDLFANATPIIIRIRTSGPQFTDVGSTNASGRATGPRLNQNYPNPFNPVTTIEYHMPRDMRVELQVVDQLGRVVATPVNGMQRAGTRTATFDGSNCSSGLYFCRLKTGNSVQCGKMLLLK